MNEQKVNKEKILMVHNYYQVRGGERAVFENEQKLLQEHGHDLITYTRDNAELNTCKYKKLLLPFTTIFSWKTYRDVKRIIKEKEIDVVHCHNTFPLISPSVYYAAIHSGVPVIQTIHNFRFLCPEGMFFCDGQICERCREKGKFGDSLKYRCYRGSWIQTMMVVTMLKLHRICGTYKKINYIFLTEFNRNKFDRLIDIHGSNVFVKPNFVNEEIPARHRMENKTFVFAGRLEENKGINLLLDRWRLLPENCILHIYGDGALKEKVEKAAAEQNNISFFGFRPQTDVFEDLLTAAGLVFPSLWYEGFPMIIAESMAMGCPVLATNLGNHGDIVSQSQGGVLFDPQSEGSFVAAVERIIADNEQLSRNAGQYYKATLSKESNYKALEEIYRAIKKGL